MWEMAGKGIGRGRALAPYACGDGVTRRLLLATYSVAHLCVDLACVMLVVGVVVPMVARHEPQAMPAIATVAILLYNMLAFAFQLPIGAMADRLDDNPMVAACGCGTIVVAYLLSAVSPIAAAVVAGIGNAMFHVGGGIDVLNAAGPGRADMPGVFVSTGAIGVFCATNWHDLGLPLPELPIALMSACGIAIILVAHLVRRRGSYVRNEEPAPELSHMPRAVALVLVGMSVTVLLRSLLGAAVAFPWSGGLAVGLASVCCVAGGKAAGGLVGDRIGWRMTAAVSLVASAVLFLLSYDSMPCGLAALFLFNMTMPLTLVPLAGTFRHNKGLAFGVTTLALFAGSEAARLLPSLPALALSLMAVASLAAILVGFKGYGESSQRFRHDGTRWVDAAEGADGNAGDEGQGAEE